MPKESRTKTAAVFDDACYGLRRRSHGLSQPLQESLSRDHGTLKSQLVPADLVWNIES